MPLRDHFHPPLDDQRSQEAGNDRLTVTGVTHFAHVRRGPRCFETILAVDRQGGVSRRSEFGNSLWYAGGSEASQGSDQKKIREITQNSGRRIAPDQAM